MRNLYIVLVILSALNLNAQPTFESYYTISTSSQDWPYTLTLTSDGGYIFAGAILGIYATTATVCKIDSVGNIQWTKHFGDANEVDVIEKILQAPNGNYVMVGVGDDSDDRPFFAEIDINGNLIWQCNLPGMEDLRASDMVSSGDGGFVYCGNEGPIFTSNSTIGKIDSTGQSVWLKVLDLCQLGRDKLFNIDRSWDGGYITSGETDCPSINGGDIIIVKVDTIGDFQWRVRIGSWSTDQVPVSGGVITTSDSAYVAVGAVSLPGTSSDVLLIKIDSSGNRIWTSTFVLNADVTMDEVIETNDGGFLLSGHVSDTVTHLQKACLVKTNSFGNVQWTKIYNDSTNFECTRQTPDGGFINLGRGSTPIIPGERVYVVKTDSLGNVPGCAVQSVTAISISNTALDTSFYNGSSISAQTIPFTLAVLPALGLNVNLIKALSCLNSVGVMENMANSDELLLYPVPSNGKVFVRSKECKEVTVFNHIGENVITSHDHEIDMSSFGRGLYFYFMTMENGKVKSGKLIIE